MMITEKNANCKRTKNPDQIMSCRPNLFVPSMSRSSKLLRLGQSPNDKESPLSMIKYIYIYMFSKKIKNIYIYINLFFVKLSHLYFIIIPNIFMCYQLHSAFLENLFSPIRQIGKLYPQFSSFSLFLVTN